MFQGIITDENGDIKVSPDVFLHLFKIGKLSDFHHTEILKRFTYDDAVCKLYATDKEKLQAFKKYLNTLFVDLEDAIQDQIDRENVNTEKSRDKYIDRFKESDFISKTEINKLCQIHKGTILKYNTCFIDKGSQGVQIKSFLIWLKGYDHKKYELFKANYKG